VKLNVPPEESEAFIRKIGALYDRELTAQLKPGEPALFATERCCRIIYERIERDGLADVPDPGNHSCIEALKVGLFLGQYLLQQDPPIKFGGGILKEELH